MIESFKRASAERITAVVSLFSGLRAGKTPQGRKARADHRKLVANLITRGRRRSGIGHGLHTAQSKAFSTFLSTISTPRRSSTSISSRWTWMAVSLWWFSRTKERHQAGAGPHGAACGHLAIIDKRRSTAEKTRQAT